MEYVNILSMVMDCDNKTTREYSSLFKDVNTEFFVDSLIISDTPITNKTKDGRFVTLYKEDGCIVLDYLFGGTGSYKSCTKMVKLEFTTDLIEKLVELQPDEPTDFMDDIIDYRKLCMVATFYDLKRDKVDFNQVSKKEQYYVCYFLRKNNDNKYYLQSELRMRNLSQNKNCQIEEVSFFFKIPPTFQRLLNSECQSSFLTELEELDEIENNPELQGLYDFDDIDEDEEFEEYEDIDDDKFTR